MLSSLNAVISINESTQIITGHVNYNPAYTYKFQLKTTIDGHHAELYEKQFDCNHCARCFIWETSLKSHLTKHRIRKQLACKYCSAKVSTFSELDNHVIEVHQMPINTLAGKTVPIDVDLDLQIPNDVKQKAKICIKYRKHGSSSFHIH